EHSTIACCAFERNTCCCQGSSCQPSCSVAHAAASSDQRSWSASVTVECAEDGRARVRETIERSHDRPTEYDPLAFEGFGLVGQVPQQPGLQLELALDPIDRQQCQAPIAIPSRVAQDLQTGRVDRQQLLEHIEASGTLPVVPCLGQTRR